MAERRVLIAMDSSEHSEKTFDWYMENMHHDEDFVLLAWNIDANPATFGTVNLMTGDPDIISKVVSEQKGHIDHTVAMLKHKLDESQLKGKVLQLHEPKAGEAIIQASSTEKADMIICGTRGLGTIRRTIMGSVSDFILHHSHVPVVICRFDKKQH